MVQVKPHVPLISFRKGPSPEPSSVPEPGGYSRPASVLEWWQKPDKYSRQPIDQREMDVINGGGADILFN